MDQYQTLYYKLFNKITDVINELQAAQTEAEEMFVSREIGGAPLQISFEEEDPR